MLARVNSLSIALVIAWIGSMVCSVATILLLDHFNLTNSLANNYAEVLGLWFEISIFGSPFLIVYIAMAFKFRWAEISLNSDEKKIGALELYYIDGKGRQHIEHAERPRFRESNASILTLKIGRLQSLWLKLDSDDAGSNQILKLAYRNMREGQDDLEVIVRILYKFDFILLESILIGLSVASFEVLWEEILFGSLAVATLIFFLVSYWFFPTRYLFRIRGYQIIGEAEEPNFLDNFTGRILTAASLESIKIKGKTASFGSVYKTYHVSLAENSEQTEKWFRSAVFTWKEYVSVDHDGTQI